MISQQLYEINPQIVQRCCIPRTWLPRIWCRRSVRKGTWRITVHTQCPQMQHFNAMSATQTSLSQQTRLLHPCRGRLHVCINSSTVWDILSSQSMRHNASIAHKMLCGRWSCSPYCLDASVTHMKQNRPSTCVTSLKQRFSSRCSSHRLNSISQKMRAILWWYLPGPKWSRILRTKMLWTKIWT
jgi:uncharacterized short protein YbdD (DUF466 family)